MLEQRTIALDFAKSSDFEKKLGFQVIVLFEILSVKSIELSEFLQSSISGSFLRERSYSLFKRGKENRGSHEKDFKRGMVENLISG